MNYNVILTEILTSLLGIVLLAMGLVLPKDKKAGIGYFSVISLTGILAFSFYNSVTDAASFSNGFYVSDVLSVFFKQAFLIAGILVAAISISYVKKLPEGRSEFFALNVFAIVGMMVISSANDFITLYIGLELMAISFIILSAFDKGSIKSAEAGTKYILLSAISSAVLLFGMSYLYGMSGSVVFSDILKYMETSYSQPLVILGCIMVIAGFAFKISAVPFHMWAPDIYEGAPTPITAFLATGSKAAGFIVIIRLFAEVMKPAYNTFLVLVIALAALSMIIGNITAIPQTNIKRMLAYSSISHAGYILLGIIAFSKISIGAMLYYLLLYIFANIGAFAAVTAFSNQTGKDDIQDFKGMWKRSPFLAATLLISLLSLAGIPPAAGFIGKFYLFSEIIRSGYLWLAFLAIGMSVVSIYYYIIVIRTMLMGEAEDESRINIPVSLKAVMAVSIAMTLLMGIYPRPLTDWATGIADIFLK